MRRDQLEATLYRSAKTLDPLKKMRDPLEATLRQPAVRLCQQESTHCKE
jgi:hypothetical protein